MHWENKVCDQNLLIFSSSSILDVLATNIYLSMTQNSYVVFLTRTLCEGVLFVSVCALQHVATISCSVANVVIYMYPSYLAFSRSNTDTSSFSSANISHFN